MESSKIAPPRQRLIDSYEFDLQKGVKYDFQKWNNERVWRSAYRDIKNEEGLSKEAIALIDVMNAFIRSCNYSEKTRASAYRIIANHVHYMDDVACQRWFDAISKEYEYAEASDGIDEYKVRFTNSHHFQYVVQATRCFYESYYMDYERVAQVMTNAIRMTSALDRNGEPLIFNKDQRELIFPHYRIFEEMSDREVLESIGVLKLHYAWKTTDDSEKQKIKRFVTAHAEEMDLAVSIVKSRYVDSLDHLETLMEASGTPALMEGAL